MRRTPRGFTLVETLVALTLLGIALLLAGAVATWANRQAERALQRSVALDIASAVADELHVRPYAEVTEGAWSLPRGALVALPNGAVRLSVAEDDELQLKTVAVEVTWDAQPPGRLVLGTAVGAIRIYP